MKQFTLGLVLGLTMTFSAFAAEENQFQQADTLDKLLQAVKKSQGADARLNQQRERRFINARNQQRALYNQAEAEYKEQEARSERLKATFLENDKKLAKMQEDLELKKGDLGEAFGVVRQKAGWASSFISGSVVSSQLPEREKFLDELAQSKKLPEIPELEQLWVALQTEMIESGKVIKYDANVVTVDGTTEQKEITRIGAFNLIHDGEYLFFDPETQKVVQLQRQPEEYIDLVGGFENGTGVMPIAIDPTRGPFLDKLKEKKTIKEYFDEGGFIAMLVIYGVLGLGIIIFLERIVFLSINGSKIKAQMRSATPGNNPLGRIMAVYLANKDADVENMELKLDEAVLKETPKIERGVSMIKVLAAVAPLLGLLGTVTGMIKVFQDITLFGAGDPKIMAGGISLALVTTVCGLVAAIPLILLHSLVSSMSNSQVHILEEQSAGLIATHAEKDV